MYSLLFLGLFSIFLALTVTPRVRDTALRLGFVDRPDSVRRLHRKPIPTLGGVAVVVSYVGAFLGLVVLTHLGAEAGLWDRRFAGASTILAGIPLALTIIPAALLVFLTGILDDIVELRPWQKFAGQLAAGGLAFWSGIRITNVVGFEVDVWLSFLVTVLWLVGCSNAFNLIDGMDGLAAGAGVFATSTILLAALMMQNFELALVCVPLVGALVGFLRYNFNPASIFLGDSGSLLIGFLLGCYAVVWSQKSTAILGMTAPLMAMALPLLDTFLAIARRFLRHQPIFGGDRDHIHHRLLASGFTPRKVVLILYGACAVAAVITLLGLASRRQDLHGLAIVLFVGAAWVGINRLGYREFGVAGRMLLQGAFQRQVRGRLAADKLDVALSAASGADEVWKAIAAACEELGFRYAEVRLEDSRYYRQFTNADPGESLPWRAVIPVREGCVELGRDFDANSGPNPSLSRLAEVLHNRLGPATAPPILDPHVEEVLSVVTPLQKLSSGVAGSR